MTLTDHLRFIFTRLSFSYILDWLIIIVFFGIAGAFTLLDPVKRDFSLTDRTISFPFRNDTISIFVLFLIAVVGPAAIILIICLLFVRLPTDLDSGPIRKIVQWKRKLWEVHAGIIGLALALSLSFFITQTMKNLFGKHRPDFLARCNPDIAHMTDFVIGGFNSEILEGTSQLVSWEICFSKNGSGLGESEFLDGFRSFPSGHCTSMLSQNLSPKEDALLMLYLQLPLLDWSISAYF
jgi:membrane-associated phospholipid phosphatase